MGGKLPRGEERERDPNMGTWRQHGSIHTAFLVGGLSSLPQVPVSPTALIGDDRQPVILLCHPGVWRKLPYAGCIITCCPCLLLNTVRHPSVLLSSLHLQPPLLLSLSFSPPSLSCLFPSFSSLTSFQSLVHSLLTLLFSPGCCGFHSKAIHHEGHPRPFPPPVADGCVARLR